MEKLIYHSTLKQLTAHLHSTISLFHGLKNRGKNLPWGDVSTFIAAITKIENMSTKTVSFNLFLSVSKQQKLNFKL